MKKRALAIKENTNMYWGHHTPNFAQAKKALEQGRDIIVHQSHYDGQKYNFYRYRVTNLRFAGNDIIGDYADGETRAKDVWMATKEVCSYSETAKI